MIFGKRYIHIILIVLISIGFTLFIASTNTEDDKNQQAFNDGYKIHSVKLPSSINFANETINLDEADLIERYDRELLTNIYWQSQTLLFIKRAHKLFPVIENILKQQGVPDDFKYLCVAESGLQFQVVSPSNATGYWQFLESTGKRYGLQINDDIDERYHLEKSTMAACAYFKEAYNEFKSWSLVAASYNMGIDGVRKQLALQKVTRYHDLYLNAETSRYLFRILAIKSVIEKPNEFGFYIAHEQLYKPAHVYRIRVDSNIADIAQYALDNNTNYKIVKLNNPWIRKNSLMVNQSIYYLTLPISQIKSTDYFSKLVNDTINLEDTHYTSSSK